MCNHSRFRNSAAATRVEDTCAKYLASFEKPRQRHSRYMQEPPAPRKAETDTTQPHSLGRLCPRQSRKWLGTLQDQQGALYFIPCIRQAIWQVWVAGKHVKMLLGDKRRQSRWGIAAAPPLSSSPLAT
ncbi:hypothetical protein ACCO45_002719 [Purpureocillium lilacinum]|uniref:Uncharacterized protein n=1 Tax=Purpureocillium lilacinum TaxID=33203 RepID=A0ACC4E0L0_PURLI